MQISLHKQEDLRRQVNKQEVNVMRQKIENHDEVTNEVFNLMGA
jgi:hypothetical protein